VRVGNIKPLVLAMVNAPTHAHAYTPSHLNTHNYCRALMQSFQCAKCGTTVEARFDDGRYTPPQECEVTPSFPASMRLLLHLLDLAAHFDEPLLNQGRCKSRNFTPDRASIETVDFQRIKLQEIVRYCFAVLFLRKTKQLIPCCTTARSAVFSHIP
jgi:hypothetical protein